MEDENDNPPQFTESVYQVAISENATVASSITRVFADDPDHGGNGDIVFTLMGGDGVFAINETSGELPPHQVVNISKSYIFVFNLEEIKCYFKVSTLMKETETSEEETAPERRRLNGFR